LNEGDGRGSPPSSSLVRSVNPKTVRFQRNTSYDGSKVPKRGSSRGTSMSSKKMEADDLILTDFDDLFAKEYKKP